MDHAVALVQAYLHINGYFTVTEYPVLQALREGGYKTATDIDLLALRLPRVAGRQGGSDAGNHERFEADPLLGTQEQRPELLIVEVKEGRAELNPGGRDPAVLEAVLTRWGFCRRDDLPGVVARLRKQGRADIRSGPRVRVLAFGSVIDPRRVRGFQAISLAHVISYLRRYIEDHWEYLRHAQMRQPALGLLALLQQAGEEEVCEEEVGDEEAGEELAEEEQPRGRS